MKDLEEQRVCVKFCFKLRKTATEKGKMLQQAFGDKCMSQMQCFEWYSRFKPGRMSIDEVCYFFLQNRHLTIREIM
jgi:hypothetical protein